MDEVNFFTIPVFRRRRRFRIMALDLAHGMAYPYSRQRNQRDGSPGWNVDVDKHDKKVAPELF